MKNLADITLNQLAAQRFQASYAGRPPVTNEQKAADLAQRMIDAIKAGALDEARGLALALKPMLGLLPEGK